MYLMKNLMTLVKYSRLELNNFIIKLLPKRKFEQKKHYLALCSIFRNEAKYMKEWLNFHLIVGYDHFYLYNNLSDDNYQKVLAPYIKKGLVTLIDWPIEHAQMQAYNDCISKFKNEANWIAFQDLDEFAIPLKYGDTKLWLKEYEKFPCVLGFFKNFTSGGKINEDDTLPITEQFVVCSDFISPSMFLNTAWADMIKEYRLSHFCRFKYFNKVCVENAGFFAGWHDTPKTLNFQFNHYHCKSYDYYINNKIPRGDVFSAKYSYDIEKFYTMEQSGGMVDYNAYRYLVKLKNFDLDKFGKYSE